MSRRKTQAAPPEVRRCARCERASFDPARRDVSDWPVIDDLDASDHCRGCWTELARTQGRPLGHPHARPGMTCPTTSYRTSSAA
jgi:hypothetical protein